MNAVAPRDAATVLLLRDAGGGGFEVFLVKRHGASGFMAGAHVFPGGKLDATDSSPALLAHARGREPAAAREALHEPELAVEIAAGLFVAGIRETFEEAGVLLGDVGDPSSLFGARHRLHQKAAFAELLAELRTPLRLDWLVPLSRWITPAVEPRRFDTRFFLTRAPENQQASHDAHETTEHAWLTPGQALDAMKDGRIVLPPPTLHSVRWLSEFATAQSALDFAAQAVPPRVQPTIEQVDGKLAIIMPGDPLHPEKEAAFPGSTRMVLEHGRFWAK